MKSSFSTKRALRLLDHDQNFLCRGTDLRSATRSGQPYLRLFVGANDGGVDVGEAIELRRAEEADIDASRPAASSEKSPEWTRPYLRSRPGCRRRSIAAARQAWRRSVPTHRPAPHRGHGSGVRGLPRLKAARCRQSRRLHCAACARRPRSSSRRQCMQGSWMYRLRLVRHPAASRYSAKSRVLQNVLVDPSVESLAIARDFIPGAVEDVVALVVAVRIGRRRAARHFAYSGHHPTRKDAGVGRRIERAHALFHRDDRRRAASTASFCTPRMPQTKARSLSSRPSARESRSHPAEPPAWRRALLR